MANQGYPVRSNEEANNPGAPKGEKPTSRDSELKGKDGFPVRDNGAAGGKS